MNQVEATPALLDALNRNGQRVEIVDGTGKLVAYALTPSELRRIEPAQLTDADVYAREGDPYDHEEVRAALADPRRYTTDEFLKKLGLE